MRKLVYFLMVATLAFVCYSCNSEEVQQRLSKAEKERLRKEDSAALKIGVLPTEDCLPVVVAKELRLFDTLGIDVHLRKYRALSECRHALTKGIVEGAALDSVLLTLINENGTELYNGLSTDLTWQFLTAKKSRISRLDQLTDKMIAADSHGESYRLAESALDSLLKKKMPVFIVQCEDVKVRYGMLIAGNVDAALLPEPFATKARKQGARLIDKVVSKPKGMIAFRKDAMADKTRKAQYDGFIKAVNIAKDSIKTYGKEKYTRLLEW